MCWIMCAAPGGKATAVGAALEGRRPSGCQRHQYVQSPGTSLQSGPFGIPNLFVANEKPEKMVKNFPEFFHKIILDAPALARACSAKEEALAKDWTPEKSQELSRIQKQLA